MLVVLFLNHDKEKKSNLKFPRLCIKLFLVTLNVAGDDVVPGENHVCPEEDWKSSGFEQNYN